MRSFASLARWLGPWTPEASRPAGVRRGGVTVDGESGPFEAWLYLPEREPHRSYLLAPGLHFDGPADPRMDRFCTVLAASGFAVLAPFLPDFLALRVTERVICDFDRAFAWLLDWPAAPPEPPGVFSISFGSLPALRLAAAPERARQLSHLVCFGGYGDWDATLEFCLTGAVDGRIDKRDPLNQPAVFINLVDVLTEVAADRETLVAAWMTYARSTWGHQEMKEPASWHAVAHRVAAGLPDELVELFLVGCGARPGAVGLCRAALARKGKAAAFVDPRSRLGTIERPVYIVHGRDDDVIPYNQAEVLAAALPPGASARVLLTGLYDHSSQAAGASSGGGVLARARDIARESWTMIEILVAIGAGQRSGRRPRFWRS